MIQEIPDDDIVIIGGKKSRRARLRKFFHLKPKKELTALEKYEKQKEKERKKKSRKNKRGKTEPKILMKIVSFLLSKKKYLYHVPIKLIVVFFFLYAAW